MLDRIHDLSIAINVIQFNTWKYTIYILITFLVSLTLHSQVTLSLITEMERSETLLQFIYEENIFVYILIF